MLLFSLAQTGDSLLRPELEVGELGPRVGGQGLPEVAHLPPCGDVQLSSTTCCRFYVPAQLLGWWWVLFKFSVLSQLLHFSITLHILPIISIHRDSLICHIKIIALH